MDILTENILSPREITRSTVLIGHEDDTFLAFFPAGFIVHKGNYMPIADRINQIKENGAMFRVQGPFGEKPQAIEQGSIECKHLNSNEAFFVVAKGGDAAWAWHGDGATQDEKNYASSLTEILTPGAAVKASIKEHEEPAEFWEALGGKSEYLSVKELSIAPGFEARLFQVSNSQGYMHMKEIYNFQQEDLCNNDVMVLDAYNTIFLWVGRQANQVERKKSIKKAEEYARNLNDRKFEDIQFVELEPCSETIVFKAFFPEWDDDYSSKWLELDPYAALMASIEAEKKKMAEAKWGKKETVYMQAGSQIFDLETLRKGIPEGVDPTKKEQHLSDEVFLQVFGMDKASFNALKDWKKKDMKKQKGLF